MTQKEPLLRAENIHKYFGSTKALKGVTLELNHGHILGLIGENGSGKSTLASVIAAIHKADSGRMLLEGEPYAPANAIEASKKGVCIILQEKGTFELMTVASNIFTGKEDLFIKNGYLNTKAMIIAAQNILDKIHADHIKAAALLGSLSLEDRKLIELARAMQSNPKILIVDETTTALSRSGRDILKKIMNDMRAKGNSIIFISHDIDELIETCDSLMILRDGDYIASLNKEQFVPSEIRRLMVGREIADNFYRTDMVSCRNDEVVLSLENVSSKGLKNVSFKLHKGEILGFGGLADCGMHELGSIAAGLAEPDLGYVRSADGMVLKGPLDATSKKIGYMSKNRDKESLMTSANISDNICIASYRKLKSGPFIWPKKENEFVNKLSDTLEIKRRSNRQFILELSGGNKQKVALAKWLGFGADVLIMDCPTRGIDVGVKSNIYNLMVKLCKEGKSIIMISEELPEIIGMSDRVIILKNGAISGEFRREDGITELALIDYMV